jgi:ABC-2 type transport system ATP-binding protein
LIYQGSALSIGTPEEIKKGVKGSILEVRSSQARNAAAVLRNIFADGDVGIFGDKLHVTVQDSASSNSQIKKALADANIPVDSIREVEPTLEDIFVSTLIHQEVRSS